MVVKMSIEDKFGWTGAVINIIVYLFSITPFIKVFQKKLEYENTPMVHVFAGYCNCFAWYYFSYFYHYDQLKFCNAVGFCIYLLLITIYLGYEIRKYLIDAILNGLLVYNGTWAAYKALNDVLTSWETIENVCLGTSLVYYIYHLHLIYRVYKEKNYRNVDEYSAIATILSSICWAVFGTSYLNYIIPKCHAIGIAVSIGEIVISRLYKKKYQTIDQANEADTIVIESNDEGSNKNDEETIKIKQKSDIIEAKSAEIK